MCKIPALVHPFLVQEKFLGRVASVTGLGELLTEMSGSHAGVFLVILAPLLANGVPLTADTVTFGHAVKNGPLKPTGRCTLPPSLHGWMCVVWCVWVGGL